jgi:hypothetical protein
MSVLLGLIVRWSAAVLIGVAAGSTARVAAVGWIAGLIGAVALLIAGTFVLGSVIASYASVFPEPGRLDPPTSLADLAGEGLARATLLGFFGAGSLVGSLNGNEATAIVSGATATVALLLSMTRAPARDHRFR